MEINSQIEKIEEEIGRLSPVHRILLGTDGSVTKMLEVLTGGGVEIRTLLQEVIESDEATAEELSISRGEQVNHRIVEIRSAASGEVLVYAISDTPLSRLSPEFKDDLMRADIPIGKILASHRIEARREICTAGQKAADTRLSGIFGIFRHEPLLTRRYRIIHNACPLISIEETFPYHRFCDEKRVIVEAPSRIHMGLIDMHGGIGRVDGGIGLTLNEPSLVIEAGYSPDVQVTSGGESEGIIRDTAGKVTASLGLHGGAAITLRQDYPRHVGLGSGTQIALATACALSHLSNKSLPAAELARIAGRGGTSGIGTAAFEEGGFILDGGHSFGAAGDKQTFRPSGASTDVRPAAVTARHEFPEDWKVVLAMPSLPQGAFSTEETDIFSQFCPVPLDDVRNVCHEVVMKMLPGIVDHDLDLFGSSVNTIQHLGFKKIELDLRPPIISRLREEMCNAGAACAGMSSFGPLVYAIADTEVREIESAAAACMAEGEGGSTIVTTARNEGASVRFT